MVNKKDLKGKDLNEVLRELEKYPYGSKQHADILEYIADTFNKHRKDNYILCTKGIFEENTLFTKAVPYHVKYEDVAEGLSDISIFAKDSPIYYEDRSLCEFNIQHRQFIVNVMVVDEHYKNAIVLREKSDKVSLIGGHVDFNKHDYTRSLTDIFNYNMKKELREEVGNSMIIRKSLPSAPTYILSSIGPKGTIYDLAHIIVLYVVVLEEKLFKEQAKLMKQKEPQNNPEVVKLEDVQKQTRRNSIRCAAEMMMQRRKHIKKETLENTPT